jgi:hypothetical protein
VIAVAALAAVKVMFSKLSEANARERERADRLESELSRLNDSIRQEYLTTIAEATRAVSDALAAVRKERN